MFALQIMSRDTAGLFLESALSRQDVPHSYSSVALCTRIKERKTDTVVFLAAYMQNDAHSSNRHVTQAMCKCVCSAGISTKPLQDKPAAENERE